MNNANGTDTDALGCNGRGVFIHRVLTLASGPLVVSEIAELAHELARLAQYPKIKENTFSPSVVRNHLVWMDKHGHAEKDERGLWQLTELARRKIAKDSTMQS